jgi:hypothetical protein
MRMIRMRIPRETTKYAVTPRGVPDRDHPADQDFSSNPV